MNEKRKNTPPPTGQARLWRTIRAVAWSILGIRKGQEYQRDMERITPLHVIAVGLIAIVLLVGGLMVLVKLVV